MKDKDKKDILVEAATSLKTAEMIEDATNYIHKKWLEEAVAPGFKNLLYKTCIDGINYAADIAVRGVDMLFGEETANSYNMGRVRYDRYSRGTSKTREYRSTVRGRNLDIQPRIDHDIPINEVSFASRAEASDVLAKMLDRLGRYGIVGADDFYHYSGFKITDEDWNISNWGWTDLKGSSIFQDRNGWHISLPPMEKFNG